MEGDGKEEEDEESARGRRKRKIKRKRKKLFKNEEKLSWGRETGEVQVISYCWEERHERVKETQKRYLHL